MEGQSACMRIVLWGSTGQAVVLAELYERLGIPIEALFDNDPLAISVLHGVPLYLGSEGFQRWLEQRDPGPVMGLAAIGGARGPDRLDVQSIFERHGIAVATALHPAAYVASNAVVGKGSQILAGSLVAARARVGEACIVNTRASVDHECELEAGVHIGPGATLAGCVIVRRNAFVGSGAVVLPRLTIGAGSIVGAGSVVTRNVEAGVVVAGNPARVLRIR